MLQKYTVEIEFEGVPGLPPTLREAAEQLGALSEHLSSCAAEYSACAPWPNDDGSVNWVDPGTGTTVVGKWTERATFETVTFELPLDRGQGAWERYATETISFGPATEAYCWESLRLTVGARADFARIVKRETTG